MNIAVKKIKLLKKNLNEIDPMNNKQNNKKLFEEYYPNGQLSFRFWKQEIKEIEKPVETYGLFYWRVFDGYKSGDFLYKIKDDFNRLDEFLCELGFQELLSDDEIFYEKTNNNEHLIYRAKSFYQSGVLMFEYTFESENMYSWHSGVENFELFYEDEQPKFRFRYENDEEDGVTGSYQMFYNNGQMKEKGSLSYSDSSFERYSEEGKLIETFCNDVFKKYE